MYYFAILTLLANLCNRSRICFIWMSYQFVTHQSINVASSMSDLSATKHLIKKSDWTFRCHSHSLYLSKLETLTGCNKLFSVLCWHISFWKSSPRRHNLYIFKILQTFEAGKNFFFFKKSHAHPGSIYLNKNTVKTLILWNTIKLHANFLQF